MQRDNPSVFGNQRLFLSWIMGYLRLLVRVMALQ